MKVAIIDMGTNTFHLLIAEITTQHASIIINERLPVKIGVGGINQGVIRDDAVARAIDALEKFKIKADQLGANNIMAFGTSALRNAKNRNEVISKIKDATGIATQIISGDEEARYIYEGINFAMKLGKEKSLIMDIGGGSVEFIIANEDEIFWKQSFEIGAQRLLEKYQKHDPILSNEIKEMDNYFHKCLVPLFNALELHPPKILVGSSGTFDTLSDIYCLQAGIVQHHSPETPFNINAFGKIYAEFIRKDRNQRMQIPGMIELRVDMIVVACCLIQFLLNQFSFEKIRVSSYSLKEGVLAFLLKAG